MTVFILDRDTMDIREVEVTSDRGGLTLPDRSWFHAPLNPTCVVFIPGPIKNVPQEWVFAYAFDRSCLLTQVKERSEREVKELAERAKTEKVWLAGFNATFGET